MERNICDSENAANGSNESADPQAAQFRAPQEARVQAPQGAPVQGPPAAASDPAEVDIVGIWLPDPSQADYVFIMSLPVFQ